MTQLSRPVRRETAITKRDGSRNSLPIMIELHTGGVLVRLKGRRRRYGLSYEAIYDAAVKAAVRAERAERKRR